MASAEHCGGATEIYILTGADGFAHGTTAPAQQFLQADVAAYGDVPGVTVYDYSTLTSEQISKMVNGPGTTIGAFCNSGACISASVTPK